MESGRRGPEDTRVEGVESAFLAAYLETQYHYVQFLTEHLADCAAEFGGDLEAVLLMAILGQRRLANAHEERPGDPIDPSRMGMSSLRIADVSGIPRETVRRKLAALQRKGWIERHPRYGWYVAGTAEATPARLSLAGLEARSIRRLARLYLQLAEIVETADR